MAKILVVGNINIPPIIAGSSKCIHSYCCLLNRMGHEVFFLYSGFATKESIIAANVFWRDKYYIYKYSLLLRVCNYIKRFLINRFLDRYTIDFYYPVYGLEKYVRKINKKEHFDAVIVNYPWMSRLLTQTDIKHKIIFTHDKFTNKKETIHVEYYSLTAEQEKEALNRADQILSIQEEETEYFKTLLPNKDIFTVFTQFDFHETLSEKKENVLFFSGNSDLNLNGINYFLNQVWPLVKKEMPSAKLVIGGGICKALRDEIKDPDIELAGYVDDVVDFYRRGNIAINPVYQGTGLKIKTLEAVAHGKIMVVHPHSVAGLFRKGEVPVFVGDSDETYATHLINALKGQIDPQKMSKKCEDYINEMNEYIVEQYKKVSYK